MQKYAERPFAPEKERLGLKNYPELLQDLLLARGITTEADAESFLHPDYETQTHDPFLMKDMERAVERVLTAIKGSERITIYSDYDCDGIPGGVLLRDFFDLIGHENVSNYIPHRHEEGYGVNLHAIEALKEEGTSLIITVDVGIQDSKAVERANELGIDVIITDHHLPGKKLPPAHAVLNPKRLDDNYPCKLLCGTGVAFKLVQGVLARNRFGLKEGKEKWLLDMVGLATVADMVPLQDENRVFVHFGLKVLQKTSRLGIQKLCRLTRVNQSFLSEDDIGFMIAPRINAASRMDEPMEAFCLLSTKDEAEAQLRAEHLNKINDQRKGVVASMAREIKKRIRERETMGSVIVMGDPRWRPALLGLAANTLMEEYGRTVCLWGREGSEVLKGSCRSDGTVNIVELMSEAREVVIESGGHALAGGFSIVHEKIHLLEETFLISYEKVRQGGTVITPSVIERRLSLDDITWETYKLIERLAPFGEGNSKPVFLFPDIEVQGVRTFGQSNAHLEFSFKNSSGKKITAIDFFSKRKKEEKIPQEKERINLLASLEKSMFRNYPELRLRIVDIV